MTNKQFLDEIIEYDKERYAFFEKYQEIAIDIFKVFHKLCIDNGITYYMFYGSLLGAYRDKGFIPWDCDIDVVVPYDEIEKLHTCLSEKMPEGYYFVSDRTERDFPYYQIRICKDLYDHGIHVDVFYLFGLPEDKSKQEKNVKKVNKLFNLRKKISSANGKTSSKSKKVAKALLRTITSTKAMNKKLDQICRKYPVKNAKSVSVVFYEDFIFSNDLFGKPILIETEKFNLLAPQKTEQYLESYFGDWKRYFPIKNRYKEFETLYNFLLGVEARHVKISQNAKETEK